MKWFTLAAMAAAVCLNSPLALADDETRNPALQTPSFGEGSMSQVAGVRIVPSIIAHDVYLKPSAWILRGGGGWANANSRVYTNKDGAITGLTLKAWGLPEHVGYNEPNMHYVVWLVDTDERRMLNLGQLDAHNMGRAVFGYTAEVPLVGYDRIVITNEQRLATGWPTSWQHLEADLPRTAMMPPTVDPALPGPDRAPLP